MPRTTGSRSCCKTCGPRFASPLLLAATVRTLTRAPPASERKKLDAVEISLQLRRQFGHMKRVTTMIVFVTYSRTRTVSSPGLVAGMEGDSR